MRTLARLPPFFPSILPTPANRPFRGRYQQRILLIKPFCSPSRVFIGRVIYPISPPFATPSPPSLSTRFSSLRNTTVTASACAPRRPHLTSRRPRSAPLHPQLAPPPDPPSRYSLMLHTSRACSSIRSLIGSSTLEHNRVIPGEAPRDFHVIWLTVVVKQIPFIGSEA